MKLTKKRVIFFLLHLAFSAIIPITLIIVQYGNVGDTKAAVGFKVGITGILLILMMFWIIKRLFVDNKIADLKVQSNVMLADLKTKQSESEIKALEREIRYIKTVEAVMNAIMPLLFIGAAIIAFRALEAQIVKLSATLSLIAVSFCIGTAFSVLHAREVHAKERR